MALRLGERAPGLGAPQSLVAGMRGRRGAAQLGSLGLLFALLALLFELLLAGVGPVLPSRSVPSACAISGVAVAPPVQQIGSKGGVEAQKAVSERKARRKKTAAEEIARMLPTLPESTFRALEERLVRDLSPIQAVAIPYLRRGHNGIVYSQTGSGKTLAYLLPAVDRVHEMDSVNDTDAIILVLAPTGELAVQIGMDAEDLVRGTLVMVHSLSRPRLPTLIQATVVVATPAELLSIFDREDAELVKYFLQRVRVCVFDEFDEMIPERRFNGMDRAKLARYQETWMWPAEAFARRLIHNNDSPDLQVIAVSATAYPASREKFAKALKDTKWGRFEGTRTPRLIQPGMTAEQLEAPLLPPEAQKIGASATLPPGITHMTWKVLADASHAESVSYALDKLRPSSALVVVCSNAGESVRLVVEELSSRGWSETESLDQALFWDRNSGRKATFGEYGNGASWRSANQFEDIRGATRQGYEGEPGSYRGAPVFVVREEAARGLHLDAVEVVCIIGLPRSPKSFMHIAGRTGRLPHPFGKSVLVARHRSIFKVIHMYKAETGLRVRDWKVLGWGPASEGPKAAAARRQTAKASSQAAAVLDAALGPPVRRRLKS